jgi:GT2 family glycosyltransferase/glycosyltransferase involved in cell wall biosynthesis
MSNLAQPMRRSVCAVAPVFNRKDLTLGCLKSLLEADISRIDLHVIIVDDGSSDGTTEAIQRAFPQVELIGGDGSLWYSEGINVGVRAALSRNPDFIMIFNTDSIFLPESLAHLLDCAEQYPTSLVGAVLVNWDNRREIFQVGTSWETRYGGWRTWMRQTIDDLPEGPFPVETIAGNCLLVPTAAFLDAGLMQSDTLPNFGDAELTARMRRRGWRLLIEPSAKVLCQPNTPPPRLSSLSWSERIDALWSRRTSYHNLRQRFAANAGGAPARWKGYVATALYVARLAAKSVGLSGRWPNDWPERPLKNIFKPLASPVPCDSGHGRMVVFAWPYVEWGGVQVYMINSLKAAKAGGYDVAAVIPRATGATQVDMLRAETENVWFFDGAQDLGEERTLRRTLERRWRTRQAALALVDIVRSHAAPNAIVHIDAGPWSLACLLRRLLKRNDVIWTIHTGLPDLKGIAYARWRRAFAVITKHPRYRLVAANGHARRSLAPYVKPDFLDRVFISPSSFDPERIDRALDARARNGTNFETRLGLRAADFRIVVGAQFIERKGYRDLLEALRILSEQNEAVHCLWLTPVLPPPDVAAILDQPRYHGLLDLRCQDDAGATQEDYFACMAQLADAFVLPSHMEGLPLALIEAMALGLACIATRIQGVPEVIRERVNGLLIPPRDPGAIVEAIQTLRRDAALRHRLGLCARRDVMETYSLKTAHMPTLAVYAELSS